MKRCGMWYFLYREANESQQHPIGADGKSLSDKAINELAQEYKDFRKEEPAEFAEMKVLNHEWLKDNFAWKTSEHQGRPQWVYEKSIDMKDKEGKKSKLITRYVVRRIPAGFQPADFKESYFTIERRVKQNDTTSIIFVDLKPSITKERVLEKK